MVTVSPFTPIFFGTDRGDGLPSRYVQTFATTDTIVIELFADSAPTAYLCSEDTGQKSAITFTSATVGEVDVYVARLSSLSVGVYSVEITDVGKSEPFEVCASVSNTTLVSYTSDTSRRRTDAVFSLLSERIIFSFRVPGGFKLSDYTFTVDNEQFEAQNCDITELYGAESTQKKFTLGAAEGAPIWFGELLNRLLCCTHVYIDGYRYVRKGNSSVDISPVHDGLDSFIFSVSLQRVNHTQPTLASLTDA